MMRIFRLLRIKREIARGIARQKAIREARQKAALKGRITEHKNRRIAAWAMFGAPHA
ncbi:hypothetical protein [Novosphingobium sp. JCM 18896]|uniref:hypothetical protein n=1 Tax=Novosphingobium sp. JCM 18896 TaxID=2989731 RepID=UPI0022219C05|nr:hypothetical protein [Novosphingobium sp. JCM 18896]MCW1431377.1 hypothetical protein [Novosphingobium sp. JCM 18896]